MSSQFELTPENLRKALDHYRQIIEGTGEDGHGGYNSLQLAMFDQVEAAAREAGLSDVELALILFPGIYSQVLHRVMTTPEGTLVLMKDPYFPITMTIAFMLKWAEGRKEKEGDDDAVQHQVGRVDGDRPRFGRRRFLGGWFGGDDQER